jgi:spore germination protein YaaH
MRWVRDVVAYLKTMPDPSRFVLGTHLYGMDWPSGGGPQHLAGAHEYAEVMAIAAQFAATPVLDPAQDAWHLAYTDAGVPHDVWYEDATTLADRFQLAHDAGIGVGFWRLGNEDQRMWDGPWLAPGFAWATGG